MTFQRFRRRPAADAGDIGDRHDAAEGRADSSCRPGSGCEFIKVNPDADRQRMVRVLQDIDPEKLEADVRAVVGLRGGNRTQAALEAIDRRYRFWRS